MLNLQISAAVVKQTKDQLRGMFYYIVQHFTFSLRNNGNVQPLLHLRIRMYKFIELLVSTRNLPKMLRKDLKKK